MLPALGVTGECSPPKRAEGPPQLLQIWHQCPCSWQLGETPLCRQPRPKQDDPFLGLIKLPKDRLTEPHQLQILGL